MKFLFLFIAIVFTGMEKLFFPQFPVFFSFIFLFLSIYPVSSPLFIFCGFFLYGVLQDSFNPLSTWISPIYFTLIAFLWCKFKNYINISLLFPRLLFLNFTLFVFIQLKLREFVSFYYLFGVVPSILTSFLIVIGSNLIWKKEKLKLLTI